MFRSSHYILDIVLLSVGRVADTHSLAYLFIFVIVTFFSHEQKFLILMGSNFNIFILCLLFIFLVSCLIFPCPKIRRYLFLLCSLELCGLHFTFRFKI